MSQTKSKRAEQQFVYRQKLKNSGGLYVGVYLKADTATALRDAKTRGDKSYGQIISMALRRTLIDEAVPANEPTTKAEAWEDFQ